MDTFQTHYLPEEHAYLITDVCFRPNSTQLATTGFDKTVKLWNAADVSYAYQFMYVPGKNICYNKTELSRNSEILVRIL